MFDVMQSQSLKQKFIRIPSRSCINPLQQRIHRGLRVGRAGMIDEKNHGHTPA